MSTQQSGSSPSFEDVIKKMQKDHEEMKKRIDELLKKMDEDLKKIKGASGTKA
jgi:Txe/YoeB family toxin of Txe-Axe toxin-antitoxin module